MDQALCIDSGSPACAVRISLRSTPQDFRVGFGIGRLHSTTSRQSSRSGNLNRCLLGGEFLFRKKTVSWSQHPCSCSSTSTAFRQKTSGGSDHCWLRLPLGAGTRFFTSSETVRSRTGCQDDTVAVRVAASPARCVERCPPSSRRVVCYTTQTHGHAGELSPPTLVERSR